MVVTTANAKELLKEGGVIELTPLFFFQPITFKLFGLFKVTMNRRMWKLTKPITAVLTNGSTITIPEGFETDLSSVPRLFWSIAPPFGKFLLAALIHDYLYVTRTGTQEEADKEMLIWSNVLNEGHLDNYVRFLGVRAFGKSWWND